MKKSTEISLSAVFIITVLICIRYSFMSNPSLAQTRVARQMMRQDMAIIRSENVKTIDFDDDRKAKISGATLRLTVSSEAWSTALMKKYKEKLNSLGWMTSNNSGEKIFLCKSGASALIMFDDSTRNGYLYMTYPSERRAACAD
ncbi:hypothetical protein [Cupriavidus plantarum]|uniref:hypothetical protein n=1 Tax=Cupriavidus plantarum TaxID=942865 RepID=UPI0011C07655|nr:hypothetical protein [Cupriavidus plantarum]NYI01543.1 hypothetical protein [Cupriavidus plantarum]